jgi:uncharacterized OB-fold protein
MHCEKPLPKPNADTKPFWDGCRNHQLTFQKCKDCGHVRWPASIICPKCYSQETQWIVAGGKGKIFSFVVYHQPFHPAFKEALPYVVAVVELEEGPHILSNIVECIHHQLKCDMAVKISWQDVTEGICLPVFRPEEKQRSGNGNG